MNAHTTPTFTCVLNEMINTVSQVRRARTLYNFKCVLVKYAINRADDEPERGKNGRFIIFYIHFMPCTQYTRQSDQGRGVAVFFCRCYLDIVVKPKALYRYHLVQARTYTCTWFSGCLKVEITTGIASERRDTLEQEGKRLRVGGKRLRTFISRIVITMSFLLLQFRMYSRVQRCSLLAIQMSRVNGSKV